MIIKTREEWLKLYAENQPCPPFEVMLELQRFANSERLRREKEGR